MPAGKEIRIKAAAVILTAIALIGEAPASPVRQLEYAFAVYATAAGHRGYFDGTLHVDILGPTDDGGTRVQMAESWYHAVRPRQPRVCSVYAAGTFHCDNGPPFPTEAELALFPLLGADFFNGSSLERPSKWRQKFSVTFEKGLYAAAASIDVTSTPQSDGRTIAGAMAGSYDQRKTTGNEVAVDATFVYDAAARLPLVVHDTRMEIPGSIYDRTSVDLQLIKDSAAAGAEAAALQRLGPVRFEDTGYGNEGDF